MPLPAMLKGAYYLGHPVRLLVTTFATVCWAHVIWEHHYAWSRAIGASMLPTFEVTSDNLIVSRWYRRGRGIKIGDIVTFDSVVEPNAKVIKRVIGMPGDYVLRDSPKQKYDDDDSQGVSQPGPGNRSSQTMLQIPAGHCWVVGDNLTDSRDSRHWGPLPMALIKGKIIAKILPWRERKWVENNVKALETD